jgi:hypothetical protein
MNNKIISLGGWCGPSIALSHKRTFALPFDHVRSTFEGVLDCIENDFKHFYPKKIKPNDYNNYLGKYIGFYHHDLKNTKVIESFKRRIDRFNNLLKISTKLIFIRTIVDENYDNELKLYFKFKEIMKYKYPNLKYILCFVIHDQISTEHIMSLDINIIVYSLKYIGQKLPDCSITGYKKIINILSQCNINTFNANLFKINLNYKIQSSNKLWIIDEMPMIDINN